MKGVGGFTMWITPQRCTQGKCMHKYLRKITTLAERTVIVTIVTIDTVIVTITSRSKEQDFIIKTYGFASF